MKGPDTPVLAECPQGEWVGTTLVDGENPESDVNGKVEMGNNEDENDLELKPPEDKHIYSRISGAMKV